MVKPLALVEGQDHVPEPLGEVPAFTIKDRQKIHVFIFSVNRHLSGWLVMVLETRKKDT